MDLGDKLQLGGRAVRVVEDPGEVELDLPTSDDADALLVFARDSASLDRHLELIVATASEDRLTWVAWPKAGKLGTDLNRDVVAERLVREGVRPVRAISIDDTWSALRFRPGRHP